jgi:hypothetical protein
MNPKCKNCRCYYIPQIKSSGLPYQTCEKCHLRVKNRYAFKTIKENTLEVYNQMTLTTKKIAKPKSSKSGKREIPVEKCTLDTENVVEPVEEEVEEPIKEEVAVEQPQEEIPFAELIGEIEPESQSVLPPVVEKKKRVRKLKVKEEPALSSEEEKCQAGFQAYEEQVDISIQDLVLPEEPPVIPQEQEALYNHDKSKVFNPLTKRWCKVDSKAGKRVVV